MGGDSSFGRDRTGGGGGAADAVGKVKDPILRVISWAKSRSPREKAILGGAGALLVSFFLLFQKAMVGIDSVSSSPPILSFSRCVFFWPLFSSQ